MNYILPTTAPIAEKDMRRFWAKVDVDPSGCLVWSAYKDGKGYGGFGHGARVVKAHRFAYEALIGIVQDGLELDHLCRNRSCVRPDHLEPVTHGENMRRGAHATKTHCPQGHEYTAENTYVGPGRRRSCRSCHTARKQAEARIVREHAAREGRPAIPLADVLVCDHISKRGNWCTRPAGHPGKHHAGPIVEKCGQISRLGTACALPLGHDGSHQKARLRADRLAPSASGPCPSCGGTGGRVDVEVDAQGVVRQTWHPCGRCGGTGVAR